MSELPIDSHDGLTAVTPHPPVPVWLIECVCNIKQMNFEVFLFFFFF